MKNIVGMISPETNWAPKLRLEQLLVLARRRSASTSRCRPNTLTRDVPGERLLDLAVQLARWPSTAP